MLGKKYIFKELSETEYIPDELEPGVVYVGRSYCCASFLCPYGCGDHVVIRIESNQHPCWTIEGNSIKPSIQKLLGCKSHFHITNGIVV